MLWGWIPAYNLCAGLGLGLGLTLFFRASERDESLRRHAGKITHVVVVALLSGLVGAHLLTRVLGAVSGPILPLRGFTFYGGLLAGGCAIIVGCNWWGVPKRAFLDAAVPGVAVAHGIGRIGCYIGGCCYGMEAGEFWSMVGFERVPVQLLESSGCFAIATLLLRVRRAVNPKPGATTALYLALYATLRFILENFRDDNRGRMGSVVGMEVSPSQAISLFWILLALVYWLVSRPRELEN